MVYKNLENTFGNKLKFLKLEPRIVFDAALPSVLDSLDTNDSSGSDVHDAADDVANASDESLIFNDQEIGYDANNQANELVVIERNIDGAEQLVANLKPNQQLLWIDANESGVDAVKNSLELMGNVDAIHIITHGNEQGFMLGIDSITQNSVEILESWQQYLSQDADILIYSCSVAGSDAGEAMLENLAVVTKADVQASDDLTGSAQKNGDWILEFQSGTINTEIAISEGIQNIYDGILSAEPAVTINDLPTNGALIGENFNITINFDNTSLVDTGYGPYINLFIPYLGADGLYDSASQAYTQDPDGVSFVSASYLGQPITAEIVTLADIDTSTDGLQFAHPIAVDENNNPVIITLSDSLGFKEGDQMVVLELPFGSYTPGQPAADIEVTLSVSNLADSDVTLPIIANSGFRYGNTAENDYETDPSVQDTVISALNSDIEEINASLYTISTVFNGLDENTVRGSGTDDETVTGPNYERSYTVYIDIADGQSLENAVLEYTLPESLVFVSATVTGGTDVTIEEPLQNKGSDLSDDVIKVNYANLSGSTEITIYFYVSDLDQNGNEIINLSNGDDVTIEMSDNVKFTGNWTPVDTRDAALSKTIITSGPSFVAKSVAIQSGSNLEDSGGSGLTPGDSLTYNLDFQISDYFGAKNLKITDTISDGQTFDTSKNPTLNLTIQGEVQASLDISDTYYTFLINEDGSTTIVFDISSLLADTYATDDLLGDLFNDDSKSGRTEGLIIFDVTINDSYTNPEEGQTSLNLKHRDKVENDVTIDVDLMDDEGAVVDSESDDSNDIRKIKAGEIDLSIYAVNGETSTDLTTLQPGDEVTFRLQYDLKSGDFQDLILNSFLPLPIFNVVDPDSDGVADYVWSEDNASSDMPGVGTYILGPLASDLFESIGISITADENSNYISFDIGDNSDVTNTAVTLDLLFTLVVKDASFADQLQLTAVAQGSDNNTFVQTTTDTSFLQSTFTQPDITITKGIVATNKTDGDIFDVTYSNQTPSSNFYDAGNTNNSPFDTSDDFVVNSSNLDELNLDSDISGVDSGDIVRFVLVIENNGSSENGAFDVSFKDQLPEGFIVPETGLNLKIVDGTGAQIYYQFLGGATSDYTALFGDGIELIDPSESNNGAIGAYDATSGKNIIIITYDLQVEDNIDIGSKITTKATLFNYAAKEEGNDFTDVDLSSNATINIQGANITTVIKETSEISTTTTDVTIGEIVTYEVTIIVPEGFAENVTFTDKLSEGLAFVSIDSIVVSENLQTNIETGFETVLNNAVIDSVEGSEARLLTLNFGNITNTDASNTASETIVITFKAMVTNVEAVNHNKEIKSEATWKSGDDKYTDSLEITVIEPQLTIGAVTPASLTPSGAELQSTADAEDEVVWFVSVLSQNNAKAFDIVLTATLPDGLTFVESGSGFYDYNGTFIAMSADETTFSMTESDGVITVTWNEFSYKDNGFVLVQIQTIVDSDVEMGDVLELTPELTWTSLPGSAQNIVGDVLAFDAERTSDESDIGGTVNTYTATQSGSITVGVDNLSLSVVQTSDTNNGDNVVPGEIVRIRVEVPIAESESGDLTLVTNLPAGLEFVNDGSATIGFVSNIGMSSNLFTITNISGDESNVADIVPDTVISIDAVSTEENLSFSLGTITNADNDASVEYVVIEFNALVKNNTSVFNGEILQFSADLKLDDSIIASSDVANLTVVEPNISIEKIVTDNVNGKITYQITLENAGTSTAYDINLLDDLDSNLNNLSDIAISFSGEVVGVTNSSYETDSQGLNININEMPVGSEVIITFTADLQSSSVVILNDTASVTWTSIEGNAATLGNSTVGIAASESGERDGSGGNNDYTASDNADLSVIRGRIFQDINADGLEDINTVDLSDIEFTLTHAGIDGVFDTNDDIVSKATTDSDGQYIIGGIPTGDVKISVTDNLPDNTEVIFDTDANSSANDGGTDNLIFLSTGQGIENTGLDFGVVSYNDAPTISSSDIADAVIEYTEGADAVLIGSNIIVNDLELDYLNNWNGASFDIMRKDGANADDIFASSGDLAPLVTGGDLTINSVVIGKVINNSAGHLSLLFNENATSSLVNLAVKQITYAMDNNNPPASIILDVILNDGNTGKQGPISANENSMEAVRSITVNIIDIDNPSLNNQPTMNILIQANDNINNQHSYSDYIGVYPITGQFRQLENSAFSNIDFSDFGYTNSIMLYITGNIDTQFILENEQENFEVAETVFRHVNPNEPLSYEARLADGGGLPSWLEFDEKKLSFKGLAPYGSRGEIQLVILAKDSQGNQAESGFKLVVSKDLADLRMNRYLEGLPHIMPASGTEDNDASEDGEETPTDEPKANDENVENTDAEKNSENKVDSDDSIDNKSDDKPDDKEKNSKDESRILDIKPQENLAYQSFSEQLVSFKSQWYNQQVNL